MRFLLTLIAVALVAYAAGFLLSVPANPEVAFWSEVMSRRDREIEEVRKNQPDTSIVFFTGGSSTAFSIDPAIIESSSGLPSFNLGLPVAAGAEYLVSQAFERTRSGDFLVICLEPDLLATSDPEGGPTPLGFAIATMAGAPGLAGGGKAIGQSLGIRDYFNLSRPGATYLTTLSARLVTGKPYRYSRDDIRYRGRIETPVRAATPGTSPGSRDLSPQGEQLLSDIRSEAKRRGVGLAYSMPWQFVESDSVAAARAVNRSLLEQIGRIIPVIEDDYSGVADQADWFSDSPQHLTAAGSSNRSNSLVRGLGNWLKPSR